MGVTGADVSAIAVMAFLIIGVPSQGKSETIKVTAVLEKPYLFEENTTDVNGNTVIGYSGFIKDVLDKVGEWKNVQFELSVRKDGQYGSIQSNGNWNGMLGEVIRHEAEIAAGPITMSAMRYRVVEFGIPFQTYGRAFILKKNPTERTKGRSIDVRLGQLFSPLEDSVWLLSGMAWFVSSLVLYLICRMNPYEWRRMVKDREATMREGESFTCVNSYWFMLGAIFWQGFMRSPRSMGGRIVVAFWWLYAFIFVSMYIASLTNYLQQGRAAKVPNHYSKIQTVEDIANDNSITLGAIRNGATADYYKYSKLKNNDRFWERMSYDDSFEDTLEDGIARVHESTPEKPYAFIAESTMAEYFVSQEPCNLYMVRDYSIAGSYAFAFPISAADSNSTIRHAVNMAILMIKDSDFFRVLEKKWFSSKCQGHHENDESSNNVNMQVPPFQKVDLVEFSGAVILLLIGLAIGSLVSLCEFGLYKYSGDEFTDLEDKNPRTKDAMLSDKGNQDGSRDAAQPMTVV